MPKCSSRTIPMIVWDIETTALHGDGNWILAFAWCIRKGDKRGRVNVDTIQKFPGKDLLDDGRLLEHMSVILSRPDHGWVTQFGKFFDERFVNTRLMINKLPPLPDMGAMHIDLWRTARYKFALRNNRLATIGEAIGCPTEKTPLEVYTWKRAMFGYKDAMAEVIEHARRDVVITDAAYVRFKPFLVDKVNLAIGSKALIDDVGSCPACGSGHINARGQQRSSVGLANRYQCQDCGKWMKGPYRKQVDVR